MDHAENHRGRLIIYGLDGATFDLILPWMEEGTLPNFSKMTADGVYGYLDPAPNLRSAASWTSFYTGKNPGKHGIYEFYDFDPNEYRIKFINGDHCKDASLWRLVSDQGLSAIVMNVPMTYPAEKINGIILAGLDAPGTGAGGFCHPQGILEELEDRFGPYILEPGLTGLILNNQLDEAVEVLFKEIEQKKKVMFHFLENRDWDLLVAVFRSLDAAQHCFWKFMDSEHSHHDPAAKAYGDVIFRVYRKLDEILGDLMARLGPNDHLMVMSDHGFGAKHPASNQLNAWLAEKGYLSFSELGGIESGFKSFRVGVLKNAYKLIGAKLSRRQKEFVSRLFPRLRNRVQTQLCYANIDWSKTRAYSDTLFPNIRINLEGREGSGIVAQGEAYDRLLAEITDQLRQCRDAESGKKIIEDVFTSKQLYSGENVSKAPDLTIRWREDVKITGIALKPSTSQNTHAADRPLVPGEDHEVISGDHRRFGIFLATGAGIKMGKKLTEVRITDLAPTALYLLGLPIPSDMDGRVIAVMLEDRIINQNNPSYIHGSPSGTRRDLRGYNREEEEEIANRLRQLGYLG